MSVNGLGIAGELDFLAPLLDKSTNEVAFKFRGKEPSVIEKMFLGSDDRNRPYVQGWMSIDGCAKIEKVANSAEAVLINVYYAAMDLLGRKIINPVASTKGPIWEKLQECRKGGYVHIIGIRSVGSGFIVTVDCHGESCMSLFRVSAWRPTITEALNILLDIIIQFPERRSLSA